MCQIAGLLLKGKGNFMTEQQHSLGTLMKAARKFKKLNQAEVAEAIGCSQSALSKMEHGLLVPSAPQWFLFSRFTAIPPESLEAGVIDRMLPLQFSNIELHGFKIPRKYRQNRVTKVRVIYSLVKFLELKHPDLFKKYLNQIDLDAEFFVDFDNLTNFQLYVDTINFYLDNNLTSDETLKEMVESTQDAIFWSHLKLGKTDSVKEVFKALIDNMNFFHADYRLTLEERAQSLKMTYHPEFHLKKVELSEAAVKFLNTFRANAFANLVTVFTGKKAKVSYELEGINQLTAHYNISLIDQ